MTFCVTFVSQNYRSQFKVAGENVLLSVESEKLKPRKPDLATWSKSRPELETGKKFTKKSRSRSLVGSTLFLVLAVATL